VKIYEGLFDDFFPALNIGVFPLLHNTRAMMMFARDILFFTIALGTPYRIVRIEITF